MTAAISFLRGINVGGNNQIKMEALRDLYKSLDLLDPRTYIQSGNVIFGTRKKNLTHLAQQISEAVALSFGVTSEIVIRTHSELRDVVARNPFAGRADILPNHLLVSFLAQHPLAEAHGNLLKLAAHPDEYRLDGRELFIHYAEGAGRPVLPASAIDKALKIRGTARNWNTIAKLLDLAKDWEASHR